MNRYELTYIIDTALEESDRKALIEKFNALIANNGGEVEKVDEWGKRRLAYAINDKLEGYYVLVTMKAPAELPREIERNMGINENIMRSLVIKLEEKKHSVKPRAVRTPVAAPAAEEAVEAPAEEVAETPAE